MGFALRVKERESFDMTRERLQNTLTDLNSFSHWFPWVSVVPSAQVTIDGQAGSVGHSLHSSEEATGSVDVVLRSLLTESTRTIVKCDLRLDGEFRFSGECVFQLEERAHQGDSIATVLEWRVDGFVPFWSVLARKLHQERLLLAVKRGLLQLRSCLAKGGAAQQIGGAEVTQVEGYHVVALAQSCSHEARPVGDCFGLNALAEVIQERNHPAPNFWVLQCDAVSLHSDLVAFKAAACYRHGTIFSVQQPLVRSEISAHSIVKADYAGPLELIGSAMNYLRNYLRVNKLEPSKELGPSFVVSGPSCEEPMQPPTLNSLSGEMRVPLKSLKI